MANRAEFLFTDALTDIHPLVDQAMELDDDTHWSRTRIIRFLRAVMNILTQDALNRNRGRKGVWGEA